MVKVIKEAFVVIGKEGSTSDGEGFIQKLWNMQMVISVKWHIWQRKTQTGVLWEYGVPCLIFPIHLNHGKMVSVKACIWQEWNVWIKQKHRMDGPNGQYRVMSISLLKTIRECLKKPLDT